MNRNNLKSMTIKFGAEIPVRERLTLYFSYHWQKVKHAVHEDISGYRNSNPLSQETGDHMQLLSGYFKFRTCNWLNFTWGVSRNTIYNFSVHTNMRGTTWDTKFKHIMDFYSFEIPLGHFSGIIFMDDFTGKPSFISFQLQYSR